MTQAELANLLLAKVPLFQGFDGETVAIPQCYLDLTSTLRLELGAWQARCHE